MWLLSVARGSIKKIDCKVETENQTKMDLVSLACGETNGSSNCNVTITDGEIAVAII